MQRAYNISLYIKGNCSRALFSGSLECPLYTSLNDYLSIYQPFAQLKTKRKLRIDILTTFTILVFRFPAFCNDKIDVSLAYMIVILSLLLAVGPSPIIQIFWASMVVSRYILFSARS